MKTKQQSNNNQTTTTQQPHKDPFGNDMMTAQQTHDNPLKTPQQPLNYHLTIPSQMFDKCQTNVGPLLQNLNT